uniref:TIR domain-containing protein n=1 Tax=Brassica campestris TaxID=3711 RepID=M4EYP7_BRACM
MNRKKKFGQRVIPVFYGLDPSHVRKQTGDFGKIFEETCHNKTEEVKTRWKEALTNVANILGYHSGNKATMIEGIANDVLDKLLLTPSKDFDNFVGIEDHIAQMSALLHLESEEVRMVGIWGSSGIGKTTIARVLFGRLSLHFQGSIYIDRRFISKSMENYSKSNPDDYNMKLHLQENFLSKILDKKIIEVDHLGVVKGKLKDLKVLIIIDDLDDQVVLDTLVGGDEWFGPRSRAILKGHGIKCIYEVGMPSENLALRMFCQSAFRQNYPPVGFMELASEVAARAGGLPLGLNILGSCLRARNKKYWVDMLPTLGKGLDGKIEKALRVSYDGLERKEHQALFRHIACFLNGDEIKNIKLMLADSELNVDIGLETLVEKSLILTYRLRNMDLQRSRNLKEIPNLSMAINLETLNLAFCSSLVELPSSIQYLNKLKKLDVTFCENLEILPTGMNLESLERFTLKGCSRLKSFPDISTNISVLDLSETAIEEFPSSLRLENLAELGMCRIKSENLWERVQPLTPLMAMLSSSLTRLYLSDIPTLVELPSLFRNLNKLKSLSIRHCINLETLPNGINLKSLDILDLTSCSRLRSFPDISTNISELFLSETGIEEVDIQLHVSNNGESTFKLKKWGISLFSSGEQTISDQNILPRVYEPDEENTVYGICHETELGDEPGDELVETMRCRKRMRRSIT